MATTFERTPEGIIYKSPIKNRGMPDLDVLTLLFDSPYPPSKPDTPLHLDCDAPTHLLTKSAQITLFRRVAATLRAHFGIGAAGADRDVVLGVSTGTYLFPTAFYATVCAGGIFSCSSPGLTPRELGAQLKQVGARLLVCNADTKPLALEAAKIAGLDAGVVLMFEEGAGGAGSFILRRAATGKEIEILPAELPWERLTDRHTLENRTVSILFSSGTTGPPKGVRLSHRNMVAECHLVASAHLRHVEARRKSGEDPDYHYRTLGHLPTAHIAGLMGYFVFPAYHGGPVCWMPRFEFGAFLANIKKFKVTDFFSVPPIYLLIAKSTAVADQLDSVRYVSSGAAPMGRELQAAAAAKMGRGKAEFTQTWGLSETTGSITVHQRGIMEPDMSGSVNSLLVMHEARMVDDDGKDVEPGQPGELWVRGPVVFKGYFQNEAATKEAFEGDWFLTGDIGTFNKDNGLFYIVDRKKELIKYKGAQVAPAELEAVLLSHPKIQDAAVIGVDSEATEVPRAYVVADQKHITAKEIVDWTAQQVSNPKRLRGGVVFLDVIPKSPSGKILRRVLRDMAKQEQSRSSKL